MPLLRSSLNRRKPGPTARSRAKRRRAEMAYAAVIRAVCVERDGYCRFAPLGNCEGVSEWAHIGDKKRARTRGMKPEQRHTTGGSMMLCKRHHQQYDDGLRTIEFTTERGADGPFTTQDVSTFVAC